LSAWYVLLLTVVLATTTQAGAFRFAWLSDTHIGSTTAAEDLRASVGDINSMTGLSFVVVSGDVTEYGSREQLRLAKEILDGLKVPAYVIPGNHDTKWSESGATDFPRLWKQDRFVFEEGGYRFIGMHQGPVMKMGDGYWAPQDVRWLESVLGGLKDTNLPIIFITHYPVDNGIANWFVVLDLLRRFNTQAILCGHGHSNRKLTFEGIPGIMGRSNLRAKNPVGGFNLVEIRDGVLSVAERPPGGETKPAWHKLALARPAELTTTTPRPDFAVNDRYPQVKKVWSFNSGYTICSSPAIAGKLAVAGDASGSVYGLELATGKPVWRFKAGNAVYSTPAVSGGTVVLGSADGNLYALDSATGKERWRQETGRPIVASPQIHGHLVYVGASDGRFRALDLESGKVEWEFGEVPGFVETRPLVYEGKVIFGAWDQHLYALEAASGKLAWKWRGDRPGTLLSPAACWPVGANGKVFIVAPDRQMTAIDVKTGAQVWRTGDYVVRESIGLSADGSRFFVRAMNDFFYAFDTAGDKPAKVWETNAGFGYDINSGMLAEKDGVVFYGTKNSLLIALEAATGKIRWQHKTGVGVMNTVVPLSDREVLTSDFDGRVILVRQNNQ
jgi:outer membrane protein assembly factor BamB/predicted phosphodiesterase